MPNGPLTVSVSGPLLVVGERLNAERIARWLIFQRIQNVLTQTWRWRFGTRFPEAVGESLKEGKFLLTINTGRTVCAHVGALLIAQFPVNEGVEPFSGRLAAAVVGRFH